VTEQNPFPPERFLGSDGNTIDPDCDGGVTQDPENPYLFRKRFGVDLPPGTVVEINPKDGEGA